ncbi:MAG: potassium/proton antiporter [Neisseriaceae bacterium]|nr:MAG: potassium/proton antiporter [Neisseriaceae bacterium]
MGTINAFFLLFGALLFFSIIATTLSARIGFPFLLIFLFVGMLAGEDGIGGIKFNNFYLATFVSQLCLAVILLDGGLNTKLQSIKMVLKPAGVLATWGVIATVLCLGVFATFLLPVNKDWKMGFLIAAIVGSTDAAAVFGLLRNSGVRLIDKVKATLEIESGANDPMAILLVTILIELILQPDITSFSSILLMLVQQLSLGFVVGIVGGIILGITLVRISLPQGLYALLVVSGGLLVFALTNLSGGSGFLSVYISGIIIGNLQRNKIGYVLSVTDGLAWLAQASMFLVLGLLVSVDRLISSAPSAMLIALLLIFVARPFAVWTSLMFFNFTKNEKYYISWVGLRGAVPVTLAILPVMMGVKDAYFLFDIGFAIVIFSLIIQGSTIPYMAKLFKVTLPAKIGANATQAIWVGDKAVVDLFGYKVQKGSEAIGKNPFKLGREVGDESIRFFSMLRDDELVDTKFSTQMQEKDFIWYVAPAEASESLARRFNNMGQEFSENLKFYGEFNVDRDLLMQDLAVAYGINLDDVSKELTASDYVKRELDSLPSAGDRVPLGDGFYLTVKDTDENNKITQLYLKIPS